MIIRPCTTCGRPWPTPDDWHGAVACDQHQPFRGEKVVGMVEYKGRLLIATTDGIYEMYPPNRNELPSMKRLEFKWI